MKDSEIKMKQACIVFEMSRQNYYKTEKQKEKKLYIETHVVRLVQEARQKQTKIGFRKLRIMLREELAKLGINIGRDEFLKILRKNNLLIKRKRKYAKTTDSSHGFRIYQNELIKEETGGSKSALLSDITYVRVGTGFMYLALVTEQKTRKIIGYDFSGSLSVEGSIRALRGAIKEMGSIEGIIHHSDRGVQYCSKAYIGILNRGSAIISMSEKGSPYENAIAERVNGILKEEYKLGIKFKDEESARRAVKEGIMLYNDYRLHMSLNYRTPSEVFTEEQEKEREGR